MLKKLAITERIYNSGALAVVRAEKERATEIAHSIISGGIDVMEVSYTLPSAPSTINYLNQEFSDKLLVGAGTVLDVPTAKDAIAHGAQFIYSPIFDKGIAELTNQYQIPYAPGCTSVTEAITALRSGATFIKIFPYGGIIGPEVIKTFKTPIPYLPLIESGGVNPSNIKNWLQAGTDIVGIGGALTKGSSKEIQKNAQLISSAIREYRNQ